MATGTRQQEAAGRRLTPVQRRREIVQAAVRVLAERGLQNFRLHHVAAAAGVSQPLISHHFGSRVELVRAAFVASDERALERVRRRVPDHDSGRARTLALALGCIEDDELVRESWMLWDQMWAYGPFEPELAEALEQRSGVWLGLYEAALREAVSDGSVHPDLDATEVARVLMSLVRGLALSLRHRLLDHDEVIALAHRAIAASLTQSR